MRFGVALKGWLALLLLAALGGCDDFPHDTEGTLERTRGGELRIGWPEGYRDDADLQALVAAVARRTGGRPRLAGGGTEPLLMRLEHGELDLVVGHFDQKSPWAKRVTFSRPAATHDLAKGKVDALAATRNGEHAFAMEVDRAVIALKGSAR